MALIGQIDTAFTLEQLTCGTPESVGDRLYVAHAVVNTSDTPISLFDYRLLSSLGSEEIKDAVRNLDLIGLVEKGATNLGRPVGTTALLPTLTFANRLVTEALIKRGGGQFGETQSRARTIAGLLRSQETVEGDPTAAHLQDEHAATTCFRGLTAIAAGRHYPDTFVTFLQQSARPRDAAGRAVCRAAINGPQSARYCLPLPVLPDGHR